MEGRYQLESIVQQHSVELLPSPFSSWDYELYVPRPTRPASTSVQTTSDSMGGDLSHVYRIPQIYNLRRGLRMK